MGFRLRRTAKEWFNKISHENRKSSPIAWDFDIWYLCLMIGMAKERSSKPADASEFRDDFIKAYKDKRLLISGLLLVTELERLGYDMNDPEETREVVDVLFDPNTTTRLSAKALTRLNEFASGGFDFLTESIETKPHHVESFLQAYLKLLRKAVGSNEVWQSFANLEPGA